jgi:6-phosphofructokinase 1
MGFEVTGLRRGWEALTHMRRHHPDPDYVRTLDRVNTRPSTDGGTFLHSSRTNPRKMRAGKLPSVVPAERLPSLETGDGVYDFTPVVLENLDRLGIHTLISIGGDDTLSYSKVLADAGVQIIAIPKTMDNDVRGTEYCIGFSTAITRAKDAINRQRTTLGSHERIGVFRVFGRNAGFTALYTAYVTSARCVIPEYRFDLRISSTSSSRTGPTTPAATVRHRPGGALSQDGLRRSARPTPTAPPQGEHRRVPGRRDQAADRHRDRQLGADVRPALGRRTPRPDGGDRPANVAMELVIDGKTAQMTAIRDGRYSYCPIPEPGARTVDVEHAYNVKRYRPHYENKIGLPVLLTPSVI